MVTFFLSPLYTVRVHFLSISTPLWSTCHVLHRPAINTRRSGQASILRFWSLTPGVVRGLKTQTILGLSSRAVICLPLTLHGHTYAAYVYPPWYGLSSPTWAKRPSVLDLTNEIVFESFVPLTLPADATSLTRPICRILSYLKDPPFP